MAAKELHKKIETTFLEIFLIFSTIGVAVVTAADYIQFDHITESLIIEFFILVGFCCSLILVKVYKLHNLAALIFSVIAMLSFGLMYFLDKGLEGVCIPVLMVLGYSFSLIFDRKLRSIMHVCNFCLIILLIVTELIRPELVQNQFNFNILVVAIPYIALYVILATSSSYLKSSYDKKGLELWTTNNQLSLTNEQVLLQNNKLSEAQQELLTVNENLEKMVNERTSYIQEQNTKIINYAFMNAHEVRGPMARILGLIYLSQMADSKEQLKTLLGKLDEEAKDLDSVIKKMNTELSESGYYKSTEL